MFGNLGFRDNDKIAMGQSSDLQIYHNGSHSYIADEGSGELIISGSRIQLMNAARSEKAIDFVQDGAVDIYYDGSRKFRTTANGVEISGDQVLDGHLDMRDSDRIRLGAGDDLQVYHDGTDSWVDNDEGDLYIIMLIFLPLQEELDGQNILMLLPERGILLGSKVHMEGWNLSMGEQMEQLQMKSHGEQLLTREYYFIMTTPRNLKPLLMV